MKLVCLGDSLTYGYGVPRRDIWTRLVAQRMDWDVVNRGVNGDTSGGMLARFVTDVLAEKPSRVLLMGGANDIMTAGTDAAARSNTAAMAQQAVARGIRPIIGLYIPIRPDMIPAPWTDLADFNALLPIFEDYRRWLLRFAAVFQLPTVDFYPTFAGPAGAALYLDGLHPNGVGHTLMADIICAAALSPNLQ